jgi:hypothetical protein
MKKLAWGARGRRFKSSHPDSFLLTTYKKHSIQEPFNFLPGGG